MLLNIDFADSLDYADFLSLEGLFRLLGESSSDGTLTFRGEPSSD